MQIQEQDKIIGESLKYNKKQFRRMNTGGSQSSRSRKEGLERSNRMRSESDGLSDDNFSAAEAEAK